MCAEVARERREGQRKPNERRDDKREEEEEIQDLRTACKGEISKVR